MGWGPFVSDVNMSDILSVCVFSMSSCETTVLLSDNQFRLKFTHCLKYQVDLTWSWVSSASSGQDITFPIEKYHWKSLNIAQGKLFTMTVRGMPQIPTQYVEFISMPPLISLLAVVTSPS